MAKKGAKPGRGKSVEITLSDEEDWDKEEEWPDEEPEKKKKKKTDTEDTGTQKRKGPPTTAERKNPQEAKATRGGGGVEYDKLPPKYKDLVAQCLQNSRDIAVIQAILFYTVIIDHDHGLVRVSIRMGKKCNDLVQKKTKNLTSPHVYVFNEWLKYMTKREDLESNDMQRIAEYLELQGKDLDVLAEHVKLARCSKTYDETKYRVQWAAFPGSATEVISDLIRECLILDGGDPKYNIAPKGPRERRLEGLMRKKDE